MGEHYGKGIISYNYQTKTFTRYHFQIGRNSLSCDWIFDIAEDSHGNIWVASTEAVDVFDRKNKHFRKYTYQPSNPRSIRYNGALALFRDSRDHMWLGTSNGLNVYDEHTDGFRYYTEKDGLSNSNIKAICEITGAIYGSAPTGGFQNLSMVVGYRLIPFLCITR